MGKLLMLCAVVILQDSFYFNSFYLIMERDNQDKIVESIKIDHLDTVLFDFNNANIVSNKYIDVPVYIKSDDDIFSLDFSLKFNNDRLFYDTILDHTGTIQFTEYFNPIDATVRFTSNSFTKYRKDSSKIVSVRFNFFKDKVESTDLNSIMAYLNGESCSVGVLGMKMTAPNSVSLIGKEEVSIHFYPNPAKDVITFVSEKTCEIEIFDIHYSDLVAAFLLNPGQSHTIPLNHMPCGTYFVRIKSKQSKYTSRFIIE